MQCNCTGIVKKREEGKPYQCQPQCKYIGNKFLTYKMGMKYEGLIVIHPGIVDTLQIFSPLLVVDPWWDRGDALPPSPPSSELSHRIFRNQC